MEREIVEQAVAALRAEGLEPGPTLVRERLGFGSYRDIVAHLRALGGDVGEPLPSGEGEEGDDAEDDAGALVAVAATPVAQAQRRLEALQEALPLAEAQLSEARHLLLNASGRELTVAHAVRRGWLPEDDATVAQVAEALTQAGQRFRDAQARLDRLPREIEAAQGALNVARREAYLVAEHPALVADLAALQAEAPDDDSDDPIVNYRRRQIWKQQVSSARARCDAAVRAAGL